MTDLQHDLTVPQFSVPDPNANTAAVPEEFAHYSDVIARSFGQNPPDSAGRNTTGEVGL